jgi:hypothetical protein
MQGKERKVPYPEAMIQVAKDKALKGDQRAAQTLINLMRELDILKPQEAFDPFKSLLAHQGLGSDLADLVGKCPTTAANTSR